MSKYSTLTYYLTSFKEEQINLNSSNPHISNRDVIFNFIRDIHKFVEDNPSLEINDYRAVLKRNNIEWNSTSMINADIQNLNDQAILASLFGVVRAERWNEGVIGLFIQNGTFIKWLEKLKELDEKSNN